MTIPNTGLVSAGLGVGSPLKSTIYTDLNRLLANDHDLDARIMTANGQITFKNCGGNCTGTCTTVCTGSCINACTNGCNGSCYNTCTGTCCGCGGTCAGHCTGCSSCNGH